MSSFRVPAQYQEHFKRVVEALAEIFTKTGDLDGPSHGTVVIQFAMIAAQLRKDKDAIATTQARWRLRYEKAEKELAALRAKVGATR